jgi:hypothetical protein
MPIQLSRCLKPQRLSIEHNCSKYKVQKHKPLMKIRKLNTTTYKLRGGSSKAQLIKPANAIALTLMPSLRISNLFQVRVGETRANLKLVNLISTQHLDSG